MANSDLKITITGDGKELRKNIEKDLKDISLSIAAASFKDIKGNLEKLVKPKLDFDVNTKNLAELNTRIAKGLNDIPVSLKIAKGTDSIKAQVQSALRGVHVELDKASLKNISNTLKSIAVPDLKFNPAAADAFRAQVQGYFNKNPINIKAVYQQSTGGGSNNNSSAGNGGNRNNGGGGGAGGSVPPVGPPNPPVNNQQISAAANNLNKLADSHTKVTKASTESTKAIGTFADRVGATTARLTAYLIPATAFFQITQAIGTAATHVKDLNVEFNRLNQILENQDSTKVGNRILDLGEKYGLAGKEILQITTTLAQAGDQFAGTEEKLVRAVEGIAKSRLSATFGDIKETTEGAVAAINQFHLSADDLNQVLDVSSRLAKKFAAESGDIFTAVQSGGAAFSAAGGNFKEFAATVTALRSLTRLSASQVGFGLNTISQRINRPDSVIFLEKLTENVGGIRDLDGALKSITDRFIQVAKATENYTDEQLQPIIEKLSDIRQGKFLLPLIRDIQRGADTSQFLKALQEADNASGSLSRDATKGLERIDVQLASIGASFDKVFAKLSNDPAIQDMIKQFASIAKSFAEGLSYVTPFVSTLLKLLALKGLFGAIGALPSFFQGIGVVKGAIGNKLETFGAGGLSTAAFEEMPGGPAPAAGFSTYPIGGKPYGIGGLIGFFDKGGSAPVTQSTGPYGPFITPRERLKQRIDDNSRRVLEASRSGYYSDLDKDSGKTFFTRAEPGSKRYNRLLKRIKFGRAALNSYTDPSFARTPESDVGRANRISFLEEAILGTKAQRAQLRQKFKVEFDQFQNDFNTALQKNKPLAANVIDARVRQLVKDPNFIKAQATGNVIGPAYKQAAEEQASGKLTEIFRQLASPSDRASAQKFAENSEKFRRTNDLRNKPVRYDSNALEFKSAFSESLQKDPTVVNKVIQQRMQELRAAGAFTTTQALTQTFTKDYTTPSGGKYQKTFNKPFNIKVFDKIAAEQQARNELRSGGLDNLLKKNSTPFQLEDATRAGQKAQRNKIVEALSDYEKELRASGLDEKQIRAAKKEYLAGVKGTAANYKTVRTQEEIYAKELKQHRQSIIDYNKTLDITTTEISPGVFAGSARPPSSPNGSILRRGLGGAGRFTGRALASVAENPAALAIIGGIAGDELSRRYRDQQKSLVDSQGNPVRNLREQANLTSLAIRKESASSSGTTGFGAGAVIGAGIGSIIPGLGTAIGIAVGGAIGAILGGAGGGLYGFFGSRGTADKNVNNQLLDVASRGKKPGESVNALNILFDNIKSRHENINSAEGFQALVDSLDAEGGSALLANIRGGTLKRAEQISRTSGKADASGFDIQETIQQELIKQYRDAFANSVDEQGNKLDPTEAANRAVLLVTQVFSRLNGPSNELAKSLGALSVKVVEETKSRNELVSSILNQGRIGLQSFISRFENGGADSGFTRSTRELNLSADIRNTNTGLQEQFSNLLLGKGSAFNLPDQLAQTFGQKLNDELGNISSINGAFNRTTAGEVIDKYTSGFLDKNSREIFADTAVLQRTIQQGGSDALFGLAGKIIPDGQKESAGVAVEKILDRYFTENLANTLTSPQAKNDVRAIFDSIKTEARANGTQFSATDAAKFAADRLGPLGNGEIFIKKLEAEFKELSSKIKEVNLKYDQSKEVLQRQIQLESQLTGTRINQIRGRASFGVESSEIVQGLDGVIAEASKNRRGFPDLSKELIDAQNNLNTNINPFNGQVLTTLEEANKAYNRVRKAQDEYTNELSRSNNVLSAFRAKFDELTKSVGGIISTNKNLGVTPIDQRFELQAKAGFTNNLADRIFAGTEAGGAKNVADLLNRFSPDQIKLLADRTKGIGGTDNFIEGTQSLERLGTRLVPGTSVTSSGRAEILQFLSGLSVADPKGDNFKQLLDQEKARKEAFEKSANIEDQQLHYLQQINEALRQNFGYSVVPYKSSNTTPVQPPSEASNNNVAPANLPSTPKLSRYENRNSSRDADQRNIITQSNQMFNQLSQALATLTQMNSATGAKEAIEALNELRETLRSIKFGGNQNVKVDANLNVTGFDGVAKDVAVKSIVVEVMKNLMNQLGSTPAEQDLRAKIAASIRQLENNK